jgi:hypothetical protein
VRGSCQLALVLFLVAGSVGCGAENWSFDTEVSSEGGPDAAAAGLDEASAVEGGLDAPGDSAVEAEPFAEAGPEAEAAAACSTDSDCPSGTPVCSLPAGSCLRCSGDVDCTGAAGGPVCSGATGACVACASDPDCAATPALSHCDATTNACVQCLTNPQCGAESFCQPAHTCSPMF